MSKPGPPPPAWVLGDARLVEHVDEMRRRHALFLTTLTQIEASEGSVHEFIITNGMDYYGLHRQASGWRFREWAPAAHAVSLVGDFNDWDPTAHPCDRLNNGTFGVYIPDEQLPNGGTRPLLRPGSKYKVALINGPSISSTGDEACHFFVMPVWAQACVQCPYSSQVCAIVPHQDIHTFPWQHKRPSKSPPSLRIYEVHPGIASEEEKVATWSHLRTKVLPRIVRLGYNALLLLGVQQHGYYASFGYQVTSYFAPSERFGSPYSLQELVDAAHGFGLLVFVELVHAHASSNVREGLPQDPHGGPYFLSGEAGHHRIWGTRLFDFSRTEVLRFLLANVLWWERAYRFDGFRLDATSTILYTHRSLGQRGQFTGDYQEYFGKHSDIDEAGYVYLKLANHIGSTECDPPLVSIAEEHSGMPGLCAPIAELGLGFFLRQAMGIPPMWVSVLSLATSPFDTRLPMDFITRELTAARAEEMRLAYCECHDQSLVGDQCLAFRLMGSSMYDGMTISSISDPRVIRGIALHKMARLATHAAAGDSYLNFIGNEFGHPEWIEMPCEGCRRLS